MPAKCRLCGFAHTGSCADYREQVKESERIREELIEKTRLDRIKWIKAHIGTFEGLESLSRKGVYELQKSIENLTEDCGCNFCK